MHNLPDMLPQLTNVFANASAVKAADKAANRYYAFSLSSSPPDSQVHTEAKKHPTNCFCLCVIDTAVETVQILLSGLIHFDPIDRERHIQECIRIFKIPGLTDWCPLALLVRLAMQQRR